MPNPSPLRTSPPEAQGLPSQAVLDFLAAVEAQCDCVHGFLLLRHQQVVAAGWWAPYQPAQPHMLFSLSKSFTSAAAGFAIAEGRLSLDDPVLSFFADERPAEVADLLAAMRVRHLLSMSTGHAEDTLGPVTRSPDGDWVRAFLACPVVHEPGTHFLYNSGATYLVSAIVQRLTGQRLVDYLRPRLFDPLGIGPAEWDTCPRGIDTGGWGLNLRTEDIARFGQCLRQDGVWDGRQVLPAGWVAEATRAHVSNGDDPNSDWSQGYGFQFWRCRHGAFRGDGAFGQYCLVMPEQDAVLAINSGLGDMQVPLNLVWEHLLPAFAPGPLPADDARARELSERLANLCLPAPAGAADSPLVADHAGRRYALEANPFGLNWLQVEPSGQAVVFGGAQGEQRLAHGRPGQWVTGTTTALGPRPRPMAAAGAWVRPDQLQTRAWILDGPFRHDLTLTLEPDQIRVALRQNVAFGEALNFDLVGRAGD